MFPRIVPISGLAMPVTVACGQRLCWIKGKRPTITRTQFWDSSYVATAAKRARPRRSIGHLDSRVRPCACARGKAVGAITGVCPNVERGRAALARCPRAQAQGLPVRSDELERLRNTVPGFSPGCWGNSRLVPARGPGEAGAVSVLTVVVVDLFWCCGRGLNSRPLPYQGSALPLSYRSKPAVRNGKTTMPCRRRVPCHMQRGTASAGPAGSLAPGPSVLGHGLTRRPPRVLRRCPGTTPDKSRETA
jgi:hypothetical protein